MTSSAKTQSVGMMEGLYFVGRYEILDWLNQFLGGSHAGPFTKIEQTANGVAACRIFDALHPGAVKLDKVRLAARNPWEFVDNYKILQQAFDKLGLDKQIDVDKLCKAKYLDNLEFMQWVKSYFERHATQDTIARDVHNAGPQRRAPSSAPGQERRAPSSAPSQARRMKAGRPQAPTMNKENSTARPLNRSTTADVSVHKAEIQTLKGTIGDLQLTIDELEKERDFYFGKLRDIEILYQTEDQEGRSSDFLRDIATILYANEEEVVVEAEEEQ